MDNEAYTSLNMTMTSLNIKYQLVPPRDHRAQYAERAIQTYKKHFMVGLFISYKDINPQLWYRLLQQEKVILKMIKKAMTLPPLSAYTQIFGGFDLTRTPLAPPGIRVVIHNRLKNCASYTPHGEDGWYIRPAMERYRCHKT